MTPPRPCRHGPRRRQRGVAALEFALIFLLGILPLILLTFTGVMIFAAQQSLSLAAAEGARAALRYQPTLPAREATAVTVAATNMQWLLDFSGLSADDLIKATSQPCTSDASLTCIDVVTSYPYDAHAFLPGTVNLYNWAVGESGLSSHAVVQLDSGIGAVADNE